MAGASGSTNLKQEAVRLENRGTRGPIKRVGVLDVQTAATVLGDGITGAARSLLDRDSA